MSPDLKPLDYVLTPEQESAVDALIHGAKLNFDPERPLTAVLMAPNEKGGLDINAFTDPHEMFPVIGEKVKQYDWSVLVTEAWVNRWKKGEEPKIMPRDDPNRKEVVVIQFTTKGTKLMWQAEIKRQSETKAQLGEFECFEGKIENPRWRDA